MKYFLTLLSPCCPQHLFQKKIKNNIVAAAEEEDLTHGEPGHDC